MRALAQALCRKLPDTRYCEWPHSLRWLGRVRLRGPALCLPARLTALRIEDLDNIAATSRPHPRGAAGAALLPPVRAAARALQRGRGVVTLRLEHRVRQHQPRSVSEIYNGPVANAYCERLVRRDAAASFSKCDFPGVLQ